MKNLLSITLAGLILPLTAFALNPVLTSQTCPSLDSIKFSKKIMGGYKGEQTYQPIPPNGWETKLSTLASYSTFDIDVGKISFIGAALTSTLPQGMLFTTTTARVDCNYHVPAYSPSLPGASFTLTTTTDRTINPNSLSANWTPGAYVWVKHCFNNNSSGFITNTLFCEWQEKA